MRTVNFTNVPLYLPYDQAAVPFGDLIPITSITNASPGVVTVPGAYTPTAGDAVTFSTTGGLPAGLVPGQLYYVVSPAGQAFSVAATKGGAAINTTSAGSGTHTLHLVSGEVDGVPLGFKANNTVVVLNLSGGSLTLQGAPDSGGVSGNPQGPGSWSNLATIAAGAAAMVNLSYDWIRVSTAGTLVALQN